LDLLSCQIQMRNSTGADTSFIAALSERGLMLVENRKGTFRPLFFLDAMCCLINYPPKPAGSQNSQFIPA
jgi:hypothetical protein